MIVGRLPTVEGQRVRMRQLEDKDLESLVGVFGDPRVVQYMGIPLFSSTDDARKFVDEIEEGIKTGTLWQWGLALTSSDEVIGTCIMVRMSWANERAEVGFALSPKYWGKGLMSEGVDLLLTHCFETLSLHRVEADADPRNEGSLKLLERNGFVREGYMKERHLVDGERQDTVFFGLLAADWRARKSGVPGLTNAS